MRISIKDWLRQRRDPWSRVFYQAFRRWRSDRMDAVRMDFAGLGPNSVVFDVGGFQGSWAAAIHERYGAQIHVFEPHPVFARQIRERFQETDAIITHDFALGRENCTLTLSDDGDASSSLRKTGAEVTGQMVRIDEFFARVQAPVIDLMKINIEGGEYALLPALVDAGVMQRIRVLQVQFHLFAPEDVSRREAIRMLLAKTHDCNWSYDFVWEQWSLRRSAIVT